jgi:very-short-patch-repair endonuclease
VRDAVDVAIRDRKATEAWLYWRLERLRRRGRPGVRRFEAVLAGRRTDGATESWLEREFLRVLRGAALPLPICQERVDHHGSFVARVDFLYADRRIVIELSGYEHHSTRVQTAADAERRTDLVLAGYRVIELTYDDVVRRPEWVIARIREALRSVEAA